MNKYAIIISGGKGTRLSPITDNIPKAMVPIQGIPILEVLIVKLRTEGFNKIIIAVNHFATRIIDYFGDGNTWGVEISYEIESTSLGTVGPLRNIKDLPEHFLFLNCDILTDLNFDSIYQDHISKKSIITIAGYHKPCDIGYGILQTNTENRLISWQEKPATLLINAGIYAAHRNIVDFIPEGQNFGANELVAKLLNYDQIVTVFSFNGSWQDVGTHEEYKKASNSAKIKNLISHQSY